MQGCEKCKPIAFRLQANRLQEIENTHCVKKTKGAIKGLNTAINLAFPAKFRHSSVSSYRSLTLGFFCKPVLDLGVSSKLASSVSVVSLIG